MNFAIEVFALHLLAPAVVVGGAVGSGPVGVFEHLGDNEVLEHLPGGLVVGFDATLVGAEQMRQQPGVDQVRLRGVCLTRSDAGSPGGQQMYEEHRLQQAYVLAHGVVRQVELGGDRAIGEACKASGSPAIRRTLARSCILRSAGQCWISSIAAT
jgi:hypothetical protein